MQSNLINEAWQVHPAAHRFARAPGINDVADGGSSAADRVLSMAWQGVIPGIPGLIIILIATKPLFCDRF